MSPFLVVTRLALVIIPPTLTRLPRNLPLRISVDDLRLEIISFFPSKNFFKRAFLDIGQFNLRGGIVVVEKIYRAAFSIVMSFGSRRNRRINRLKQSRAPFVHAVERAAFYKIFKATSSKIFGINPPAKIRQRFKFPAEFAFVNEIFRGNFADSFNRRQKLLCPCSAKVRRKPQLCPRPQRTTSSPPCILRGNAP